MSFETTQPPNQQPDEQPDQPPDQPPDQQPHDPAERRLQPALHEVVTCLAATTVALSAQDGQIDSIGALGLYCGDVRVLSTAVVTVDGRRPEALGFSTATAGEVAFVGALRQLGDAGPDPTVWMRRRRRVDADSMTDSMAGSMAGSMTEAITVDNVSGSELQITVALAVRSDLARIEETRAGIVPTPRTPQARGEGLIVADSAFTVHITGSGSVIEVTPVSYTHLTLPTIYSV